MRFRVRSLFSTSLVLLKKATLKLGTLLLPIVFDRLCFCVSSACNSVPSTFSTFSLKMDRSEFSSSTIVYGIRLRMLSERLTGDRCTSIRDLIRFSSYSILSVSFFKCLALLSKKSNLRFWNCAHVASRYSRVRFLNWCLNHLGMPCFELPASMLALSRIF